MSDIRLSMVLAPETAKFLRESSKREGRSMTEIVRRALEVYKLVAYEEAGNIYIVDTESGASSKVLVL